jgi:DNA-binding response OmpR family regulator
MTNVLLVEDEQGIAEILRLALDEGGYRLDHAVTLAEARQLLVGNGYDAILLDLNLPDGNGIDLCREIRAGSTVPIVILTARQSEVDRILGLELGADDYVVKPFSPREVVARLGAILRRQSWERKPEEGLGVVRWKGMEVDETRREVRVDGVLVSLTRTEFQLVLTLVSRPGQVFSREQLIELVWNGAYIQDRVVDSVVSRVRRKLGVNPDGQTYIRTVHGVGYALGG